jgi:hypothetical protein
MKLYIKKRKINQFVLFAVCTLIFTACGSYQNVSSNDGIYGEETENFRKENKQVIVIDEKEREVYEKDYFTKSLDNLQRIENEEIFTDVDNYSSNEGFDENYNEDFNSNQPWGYEDNNVFVDININRDPFWGGFNHWGWGFNNPWAFNNFGWGFNNPWAFNNWGRRWGFRNRGFGSVWDWSYNSWGFINPYTQAWGGRGLHPFLPNFGITGFRYDRARYGRRIANNSTLRRSAYNINGNRRYSTSRRNSNVSSNNRNIRGTGYNINGNRRYSTTRRNSNAQPNSSNTSIRRNGNSSTRRSSSIRRGSTSNSRNSSTRRGTTNRSNRSASSSRSSRSRSSSASSSSRSSSSRASSSSSRGSSRSSGRSSSRSSSSRKRGN